MFRKVPIHLAWLAAALALAPGALAQKAGVEARGAAGPRVFKEHSGTLPARAGQHLHLATDIGSVRILTSRESGQVAYRVRVEGDANQPDAQQAVEQFVVHAKAVADGVQITGEAPWRRFRGRIFVNFEVSVPLQYHLDVRTQAGSVATGDLDGQASIFSAGGNITLGRVGGPARLETQGGHIAVKSVQGNLQAITAGGHVNVGPVMGDAAVNSLGGHINVASVRGSAQFETAGGNIQLQRAGGGVTASTAGGRIDLGETAGAIRAKTAGGGIRVVRMGGPTQLETSGGSIYLTRVQGQVRAMTAVGGITAWFASDSKLSGASQLESASGDIVVYIPRDLAITIEASIEGDGDHRIEPEPGIPLKIVYADSPRRPKVIRAEAKLNGGSSNVLRLRALAGDIRLKYLDTHRSYWERLAQQQMEQFEKSSVIDKMIREHQLYLQQYMRGESERLGREAERHLQQQAEQQAADRAREAERAREEEKRGRVEVWRLRVEESISGRINVNADAQANKLISKVKPEYPELARRNEIEGVVWLEVHIDKEGRVENLNRIEGHPALVQAAMEAVKQWRYAPTYLNGRPVAVATVVRLEFRMN